MYVAGKGRNTVCTSHMSCAALSWALFPGLMGSRWEPGLPLGSLC